MHGRAIVSFAAFVSGAATFEVILGGCATGVPESALRLHESTLEVRNIQSHHFVEVVSEAQIMAASVAVLQDMEYNLDEIAKPLGVLSASKVVDADSLREKAGLLFLDIACAAATLGGGSCNALASASDEQKIMLTLVVLPSLANERSYVARITMQRLVYDKQERLKLREQIENPEIYQQIFANLSKSIALQAAGQ